MRIRTLRDEENIAFAPEAALASGAYENFSTGNGNEQYAQAQVTVPEDKKLKTLGNRELLSLIHQVAQADDKYARLSQSSRLWTGKFSKLSSSLSDPQRNIVINILTQYRDSDVKIPQGVNPLEFYLQMEKELVPKLIEAMTVNLRETEQLLDKAEFRLLSDFHEEVKGGEILTISRLYTVEDILDKLEKGKSNSVHCLVGLLKQNMDGKRELGLLAREALKIAQTIIDSEHSENPYESSPKKILTEAISVIGKLPDDEKIEFSGLFREYLIEKKPLGKEFPHTWKERFTVSLLAVSLTPNNVPAIETLSDFILSENGLKAKSHNSVIEAVNALARLKNNDLVRRIIEAIHERKIPFAQNSAEIYLRELNSSLVSKGPVPFEIRRQEAVKKIRQLWDKGFLPLFPPWVKKRDPELFANVTSSQVFRGLSNAVKAAGFPAECLKEIRLQLPVGGYKDKNYVSELIKQKSERGESLEVLDVIRDKRNHRLLTAAIFHWEKWADAVKESTGLEIKFPPLREVSPEYIEEVACRAGITSAFPV